MSFYSLVFTVPRNTAETSPYEPKLPVSGGILHQVSILIPAGHAGLTGCAIDEGLHQIAPSNQNEWFKGDDVRFTYPEYIELPRDTRELVLRGFNLDDTYDHSFVIGVGIMPAAVYNALLNLAASMQPLIANVSQLTQFFQPPASPPGG